MGQSKARILELDLNFAYGWQEPLFQLANDASQGVLLGEAGSRNRAGTGTQVVYALTPALNPGSCTLYFLPRFAVNQKLFLKIKLR